MPKKHVQAEKPPKNKLPKAPIKKKKEEEEKLESPSKCGCMSPVFKLPIELINEYAPGSKSFNDLWDLKPTDPGKVKIYGKVVPVPRWQKPYLRDYEFSGLNHEADVEVPEILKPFFDYAQNSKYGKDKDGPFNQILVNGYKNGHEYIGAHSDKEPQIIEGSCIMSISLGETRTFRITGKKSGKKIEDIILQHGEVVVMMGSMQKIYKHQIVKVGGKKGKKMGKRINITLRKFKK